MGLTQKFVVMNPIEIQRCRAILESIPGILYDWVDKISVDEIAEWRHFYGLQSWMKQLYLKNGGNNLTPLSFYETYTPLTLEDLDNLEEASAFLEFYAKTYWYNNAVDEKNHFANSLKTAIAKARNALQNGKLLYYYNED